MASKISKFLKGLFCSPVPAIVAEPAKGIIACKTSDFTTVTLKHTGGENYEIVTTGNLTKQAVGIYRQGKGKAVNYFDFVCALECVK